MSSTRHIFNCFSDLTYRRLKRYIPGGTLSGLCVGVFSVYGNYRYAKEKKDSAYDDNFTDYLNSNAGLYNCTLIRDHNNLLNCTVSSYVNTLISQADEYSQTISKEIFNNNYSIPYSALLGFGGGFIAAAFFIWLLSDKLQNERQTEPLLPPQPLSDEKSEAQIELQDIASEPTPPPKPRKKRTPSQIFQRSFDNYEASLSGRRQSINDRVNILGYGIDASDENYSLENDNSPFVSTMDDSKNSESSISTTLAR